jgi:hypothetical protein
MRQHRSTNEDSAWGLGRGLINSALRKIIKDMGKLKTSRLRGLSLGGLCSVRCTCYIDSSLGTTFIQRLQMHFGHPCGRVQAVLALRCSTHNSPCSPIIVMLQLLSCQVLLTQQYCVKMCVGRDAVYCCIILNGKDWTWGTNKQKSERFGKFNF